MYKPLEKNWLAHTYRSETKLGAGVKYISE